LFFLMRTILRGQRNVRIIASEKDDPHLSPGTADTVLICNTYHEFENPGQMLDHSYRALRPGGRLMIVDRWRHETEQGHGTALQEVEALVTRQGFAILNRDERFIENRGEDRWWLLAAKRP